MTRVYLHVGAPKTGTTYLQEVLFRNRGRLAEHGLLYPGDSSTAHYSAVLDLRGLSFGGYDDPDADGAWEALARAARGWRGDAVLISHELLAGADEETITTALSSLGDHEVHVVVTVRDLGRQVPAVWQEMVKNRQTVDYPTYLKHLTRARRRGRPAKVFWRQQDVVAVLEHWSAFVPAHRMHLITVPPAGSSPTLLWERLCQVVGIAPDGYDTVVPRTNASLGMAEAELVRRINLTLEDRLPWPEFASTVKFWFAEQLLSSRRESTRTQVPDRLRPWFDDAAATMVAGIRSHGYDVVGDLADLRPVYGPPGAADAPDPSEVVDAAAYALAELLAERALERPVGAARVVQDFSARWRGARRRRLLRLLPEPAKRRLRGTGRR
ncbi:MAG: hypothetical protein K0Q93_2453 [Nocardioidaceae bacterium]|jgi:hypothetical protein|nr:hypothetical protein [Nocardioidaceae bacterium]